MSRGTTAPKRARVNFPSVISRSYSDMILDALDTNDHTVEHETHEWTIDDIGKAAGVAARTRVVSSMDGHERWETAWGDIAIAVCDGTPLDRFVDLVSIGMHAIATEDAARRRDIGLADNARAHAAYHLVPVLDYEDRMAEMVADKIAFRQVLDQMRPDQIETLLIQSTSVNQQDAAKRAGVAVSTHAARLKDARQEWFDRWFWPEPVPDLPRAAFKNREVSTHCKRGHEWTPENTRWRKATSGVGRKRSCRECDRIHEQARKDAA